MKLLYPLIILFACSTEPETSEIGYGYLELSWILWSSVEYTSPDCPNNLHFYSQNDYYAEFYGTDFVVIKPYETNENSSNELTDLQVPQAIAAFQISPELYCFSDSSSIDSLEILTYNVYDNIVCSSDVPYTFSCTYVDSLFQYELLNSSNP